MAQVLATATSPSCIRSRALIGGPAVRTMATVGGNLFAPRPMATSRSRCWRSTRGRRCWRHGARAMALEEFLRPATASRARWCRRHHRPAARRAGVPLPQGQPRQAERHLGDVDRGPPAAGGGRVTSAARRLWGHGADAVRAGGRARARRPQPRRSRHRPGAGGRHRGLDPPTDAIASRWYRREVAPCICAACCSTRR